MFPAFNVVKSEASPQVSTKFRKILLINISTH